MDHDAGTAPHHGDADDPDSAFGFTGTWREFAPIAFTNLLLTIVTLGIYRFWATARERRYLWSRTRFVDEHLEWAGTGMELFLGFLDMTWPPADSASEFEIESRRELSFSILNYGITALGTAWVASFAYLVVMRNQQKQAEAEQ